MSVQHQLAEQVSKSIQAAQAAGDLPAFEIPEILIERPRDPSHGDYACPSALRLAKVARMAPIKIAQAIADNFPTQDYVEAVNVAPPGFLNIRLATDWVQNLANQILDEGMEYGRINIGAGKKAQVECVSANPTGPITLGRTRGGVIGDTIGRAMKAAGYDVTMEYYYNDAGRQVKMLGESVNIRYRQLLGEDVELTDEHYQGRLHHRDCQRFVWRTRRQIGR